MIENGDWVLLYLNDDIRYVVKASPDLKFHTHKGYLLGSDIVGKEYGETVTTSGNIPFVILKPQIRDFIRKFSRSSQIIYPKDAATIINYLGIAPGSVVLEGGVGSAALTVAMAHAVGVTGKIIGYDTRQEAIDTARKNLESIGISNVELRLGKVESYSESPLDAVTLDIPSPWEVAGWIKSALKPSSFCSCLCPTFNQVEKTVLALRDQGFVDVQAVEILERKIKVAENATRPENIGLSHTAFLVFARSTKLNFRFEEVGQKHRENKAQDEAKEAATYYEQSDQGLVRA